MKKYLLSTVAAVGMCALSANAFAGNMMSHTERADEGFYVLGEAGYGFGVKRYDDNGILGLGMGYKINPMFRADVIAAYRGWGKLKFSDATKKADAWAIPVLANLYAEVPMFHDRVSVYGMGGIGFSYNKVKSIPGANSNHKTSFAWNIGAGIEYMVNSCWSVDLGYRYSDLGDARLNFADGRRKEEMRSHDILLTARYHF